jgi:hypothetical protein
VFAHDPQHIMLTSIKISAATNVPGKYIATTSIKTRHSRELNYHKHETLKPLPTHAQARAGLA